MGTTEELCISKIEGAIRGIKLGTKKPEDTNIGSLFHRLQPLNQGMYEDLLVKYMAVKKDYDQKKK